MSSSQSTVSHNIISPSKNLSQSSQCNYDFLSSAYQNPEPTFFQHRNGRMSKLVFVPVCLNDQSFKSQGRKVIESVVQSMSKNQKSDTYHGEMIAAKCIIKYLCNTYPKSFESVARKIVPGNIQLDPFRRVL